MSSRLASSRDRDEREADEQRNQRKSPGSPALGADGHIADDAEKPEEYEADPDAAGYHVASVRHATPDRLTPVVTER